MDTAITFEDHSEQMRKLPIIFHRNMQCSSKKIHSINWHENIEILRVTVGEGTVVCGEKLLDIKKNDLFVINANTAHAIISGSFLQYDCMIIDRNFAFYNGMDTSELFFDTYIHDAILLEAFDKIAQVVSDSPLLLDVNAALLPFLCRLYHQYAKKVSKDFSAQKDKDPIQSALIYIKENLAQNLALDDIANAAGISKYHFARKFKNSTGFSPMEYVTLQRCELAKTLLAEKSYSMKQIALLTGFESASYFSKVFFKNTGIHPSKYK